MSGLINSNIAGVLVRENVQPGVIDLTNRRTDFINFLSEIGAVKEWSGGDPAGWNLEYGSNSSAETFVEGQALPVAGKQSYARAQLAPFFVRVAAQYSGRVEDQVRNGGVYADPIQRAVDKGIEDAMVKLEASLLGTAQDTGVQSAIDSGDTYANVAPGTVSTWASLETAVGGALSFTVLEDNIEVLAQTPYKSNLNVYLACQNQLTNYGRLAGSSATTSLMRFAPPAQAGGQMDLGPMVNGIEGYIKGALSHNGVPFRGIQNLTNSVILGLDTTSGVELRLWRPMSIKPMGATSDDTILQVSIAGALFVLQRNAHMKLTGLTA